MPGLGDEFRAARTARRLSLSDVSEQIHIRSVYLQRIEEEDWAAMGAPVYARGFVRTYARFLGLDPELAVSHLAAAIGTGEPHRAPETRIIRRRSGGRSWWLWLATAVAGCLVAFVAYNFVALQRDANAMRVASRAGGTLQVRLTHPSSISVTIDGSPALDGDFGAGLQRSFHGRSATIRAGNAAGVDLTVNGKELGTMGASGSVVDRSISLAAE